MVLCFLAIERELVKIVVPEVVFFAEEGRSHEDPHCRRTAPGYASQGLDGPAAARWGSDGRWVFVGLEPWRLGLSSSKMANPTVFLAVGCQTGERSKGHHGSFRMTSHASIDEPSAHRGG